MKTASSMPSKPLKRFRGSTIFWFGGILLAFSFLMYQHAHVIQIVQDDGRTTTSGHHSKDAPIFLNLGRPTTNETTPTTVRERTINSTLASTATMRTITGYFDATIREFERQDGVVIATKIHSHVYLPMLEQMLCLLHQAYNHHLQYDIVVFTTEPIDPTLIINLTRSIAPVNLTVVQDNRGLQREIADLSPERRQQFVQDCGLQSDAELVNLTWFSKCPGRIAYNHQAEFRSWHIWKHPALQKYHWMMWLDADAFCSRKWTRDPIAIAMQHNLTIFFDNFPQGFAGGKEIQERIQAALNGSLCAVKMTPEGYFNRRINEQCEGIRGNANIPLVHGFFHITNMDFYRRHINWAKVLIGNGFLQRKFDDQVAVTVPAAYYTPNQSFLFRKVGVELGVYHNGKVDGYNKVKGGGFLRFWEKRGGKEHFPEGEQNCDVISGG